MERSMRPDHSRSTVAALNEDRQSPASEIGRRRNRALSKGSQTYQDRRREIARVAAEVFNKHGFRGTSLSAVADALGTDRASLYYYIANKGELFDEVVREVTEANVATAETVLATLSWWAKA